MSEQTLTVLFTERAGALERIVSLLRRRSFPISGLTIERTHEVNVGRVSITVGQPSAVPQVRRHLLRLPDVRGVRVENRNAVCREYALVRVRGSTAEQKAIIAAVSPFGARALHAGVDDLVIEATGHRAHIDELFCILAAYHIEESARTSPMALGHKASNDALVAERNRQESSGSH